MNAPPTFPTHRLQRFTRTAQRLIVGALRSEGSRRNFLALADQAVVSAASFGTAMLLGRFGSPEELGVYALALTILMLMANVQGELITAPYILFRPRRNAADVPWYTGSMIVHELIIMGAASCVFALISFASSCGLLPATVRQPMLILALAGPLWLVRAFIRYMSFANLQFGTALIVDTATAIVQLVLLVSLLRQDRLTAANTYAAMGAACLIAAIGWGLSRRLPFQLNVRRAANDFLSNWSFSRWALASQLVGCITPYILPWILAHGRGDAETGTFAACSNLCGVATMFVLGLAHALTPQAAQAYANGGRQELLRILMKTAGLFVMGVGAFCVAILAAGDFAMTFIYGPSFSGTHLTVTLLAFSVLANSFAIVSGNGLWAVNRPQANLIADVTVLSVTLISAAVLIPSLGIVGAAAATLLGSAAGAATRWLVFRRVLRDLCPAAVTT